MQLISKTLCLSALLLVSFFSLPVGKLQADTVSDLQTKVSSLQTERQKLAEEIAALQKQLSTTKTQSASLKAEIAKIELTRAKLAKEIQRTQVEIKQASINIRQLTGQIGDKQQKINTERADLNETLRAFNRLDQIDWLANALAGESLAELGAQAANFSQLQASLVDNLRNLQGLKKQLEVKKSDQEITKQNLGKLENQLSDQKQIADVTKQAKDQLLTQTKNQEANYQKLLADRRVKMQKVQDEMAKAETELKLTINTALLPKTGTGALAWPVDKIIITQGFGLTAFAQNHTTLYGGNGHNGIDFGVSVGTVIKAARAGTVLRAGDTDTVCQGASYGKWVLVRHDNGLTSLYAHLSLIKVAAGQAVSTGQVVAYSGNTGYSTGPHLHFTVYASDGVKIGDLVSKVPGCGTYHVPLGAKGAYLNPLDYLPAR